VKKTKTISLARRTSLTDGGDRKKWLGKRDGKWEKDAKKKGNGHKKQTDTSHNEGSRESNGGVGVVKNKGGSLNQRANGNEADSFW